MTAPVESSPVARTPLTDAEVPAQPVATTGTATEAGRSAEPGIEQQKPLSTIRALAQRWLPGKSATGEAPEDPRDWITPEDLNVAPALLGLPLGTPMRRAQAMGIDLLLLTILSHFGNTLLAAGCFWAGWRWYRSHGGSRASRGEVKGGGWVGWVPVMCLLAFGLYTSVREQLDDLPTKARRYTAVHEAARAAATDPADRGSDDDEEESTPPAASTAPNAAAAPTTPPTLTTALTPATPTTPAASGSGTGALAAAPARDADAELKAQRQRIKALESQVRSLKDEADRTLLERLRHWWKFAGLNLAWAFGWFVLWPLILGGQTPGKRLRGLKIVELTGKPLKPMLYVRRYGGYAAGATTGGMGFLQILWDGNRQGLHDKAAHTAVIDLRNTRRLRLREDLTG